MIKSFRHKGLEALVRTGTRSGIRPDHAGKLKMQLFALDLAKDAGDMGALGWRLHPLTGKYKGFWAVTVNGNWRLVFRFEGSNAELVDYLDYH